MEDNLIHASHTRRFGLRRHLALSLFACAGVALALAVLGVILAPASVVSDFTVKNLAPALSHPFGTDWMGRDMFARTVCGLGISALIGAVSTVLSCLLALVFAGLAAFGGTRVDAAVSWLIDLVLGIPHIVLLILVSYALGRGTLGVAVGVALTHWPGLARVLRAEMLGCLSQPYIQASRALGVRQGRIFVSHVLPAVLPQLICGAVLAFPHAVLHEASITFLGFGLPSELPAIGVILSESMGYLSAGMWWLAFFPGLSLVAVTLLLSRVGSLVRQVTSAAKVQG